MGSHTDRRPTLRSFLDIIAASTVRTLTAIVVLVGLVALGAVKGFDLTVFGALGLFFVLWWTFLFAVLPLGNRPEADPARIVPGQDPGAPASPRLRLKALLTTLVAAVVFFVALSIFPLARL